MEPCGLCGLTAWSQCIAQWSGSRAVRRTGTRGRSAGPGEDPPLDASPGCAGRQAHTLPEGLVRLLPGTAGLLLGQPRGSAAIRSRRRPPGGPPEAPPQGAWYSYQQCYHPYTDQRLSALRPAGRGQPGAGLGPLAGASRGPGLARWPGPAGGRAWPAGKLTTGAARVRCPDAKKPGLQAGLFAGQARGLPKFAGRRV